MNFSLVEAYLKLLFDIVWSHNILFLLMSSNLTVKGSFFRKKKHRTRSDKYGGLMHLYNPVFCPQNINTDFIILFKVAVTYLGISLSYKLLNCIHILNKICNFKMKNLKKKKKIKASVSILFDHTLYNSKCIHKKFQNEKKNDSMKNLVHD